MRRYLLSTALFAACTYACLREFGLEKKHTHRQRLAKRQADFPPTSSETESILLNSFDNVTLDEWSYYYTHKQKLAGTGQEAAQWTADKWAEYGFTSRLDEYHVYLSYPVSASLSISHPNGTTEDVSLIEDKLVEDDVTNWEDNQPSFHGYSASGDVTAEYVYVGRGQQVDFARLVELGVELEGKIALARYGGPFRGLKVKNAQDHGMIGVVIFTDPGDDGEITVANGYEAYPDGPARNPSTVQKGSVLFLSTRAGDPTTPGYPSKADSPRADISDVVPKIPSVPLSYRSVLPLLQALDGFGPAGEEVNRTRWVGALDATYSTGPAPGVTLSLHNLMESKITPIWNVIGYINGTNSDETLVIGNHRDTWMVGGAGDPNSGSAVMVELAKAFGKLLKTGWKPTRNIVLASWDAEEYGMIGSTEFVEEYINWLTETTVAYLNIDVAVTGPNPDISATPELHAIATDIMKKVIHPSKGAFNQTLFDVWQNVSGEVGVLGSGSDYGTFLHRGIGAVDLGSGGGPGDPVWGYHSNYDTYHWMANFGDPGFHVHKTMGQYLALLAYHLADDELLPFDLPNYGVELRAYYEDLLDVIEASGEELDTSELLEAIETFELRAGEVKALERLAVLTNDAALIAVVNHKYRDFQRGFVSQGGLPTREFYRHVVNAPGLDTGYAPVTYPGVTEAIDAADFETARDWVSRTARGIHRAADIIKT